MKMTTTFNKLREKSMCEIGYKKLAKHLGGVRKYGAGTEIDLLIILDQNGFDDAVWSLRATKEDCDNIKRLIACDFAWSVLNIFEQNILCDELPRKAIEASRGLLSGSVSAEEMRLASYAAYAASFAVDSISSPAAASAAASATDSAAYAASASATYATYAVTNPYSVADRKAKKEQMSGILRKHLS